MPRDSIRARRSGTVFRYVPAKPCEKHGHYVVRCSAPDGSRPLFHLDPGPKSPEAKRAAEHTAEGITEKLWAQGLGAEPRRPRARRIMTDTDASNARDWWHRFFAHRDALGMISVAGIYRTHVVPVLNLPWLSIEASDIERFRDALDTRVAAGEISAKTAFNAWTVVRTAAKAASGRWAKDKRRTLKVRDTDPSDGVVGPDYDPDDALKLQWLYPREILAIGACLTLPLAVRQRIILAVYLCLRGGELKALTWDKVDLERGVVIIDQSFDRETGAVKKTKSGNRGARRYSFEPALLPLLRVLHREAKGTGNVIEMPDQKHWARELREALKAAGITRPELFTTTATSKRVRFHDLKASGLTWKAIRGDSPAEIQYIGAHTTFEMTRKYIDAGGAVDLLPGEDVFPELPACLLREPTPNASVPPRSGTGGNGGRALPPVAAAATLSRLLSQDVQVLGSTVEAPGIEPGGEMADRRI